MVLEFSGGFCPVGPLAPHCTVRLRRADWMTSEQCWPGWSAEMCRGISVVYNLKDFAFLKIFLGFWACDRSCHLQNGKPARRKSPGKWERKLKMASGSRKWPPTWKSRAQNGIFRVWRHFPFCFPFSANHRVGPVSHSVNGHCDRNSGHFYFPQQRREKSDDEIR